MAELDEDRQARRNGTRLRQIAGQKSQRSGIELDPASAFEAVTRQMVVDLRGEIQSLKARIDSLFSVVIGAIVLDLLLRLAGLR